MLYDLEAHAKDGRCGLSRNEDIRRFEGKLIEKQTLDHLRLAILLVDGPTSFCQCHYRRSAACDKVQVGMLLVLQIR